MKKSLLSTFFGLLILITSQVNAQTGTKVTPDGTTSSGVSTDVQAFPGCQSLAYQVINYPGKFQTIDLGSATRSTIFTFPVFAVNAMGFNPKDNLIYGIAVTKNPGNSSTGYSPELVVIGSNKKFQILTTVGIPLPGAAGTGTLGRTPFLGDVNEDGILFISEKNGLYKIDLNKGSADYLKVVLVRNYSPTETAKLDGAADIAFPAGDKRYAYTVNKTGDVIKIDTDDGTFTSVDNVINSGGPFGFGTAFFDNENSLYVNNNIDATIYKIFNATTGSPTWTVFSPSGGVADNSNDGARCPNSAVPPYVTGTVYIDKNGSTPVNNVFPLPATQLYAQLVNSSNVVVKSVPVSTDGIYQISLYNTTGNVILTGNYSVHITTASGIGSPSTSLPYNYVHVSSWGPTGGTPDPTPGDGKIPIGTPVLGTNIVGVNFGIEQLPNSTDVTIDVPGKVGVGDYAFLDDSYQGDNPVQFPSLKGTDPEEVTLPTGSVSSVKITTLANNADLFYNGSPTPLQAGDIITNYDKSLLKLVVTQPGSNKIIFKFAYLDAAGKEDPTPATYTINYIYTLPVQISSFTAEVDNEDARLNWTTSNEQNNAGFGVQHSVDGNNWNLLYFVNSKAVNGISSMQISYQYIDKNITTGTHYYRLKQTDLDGNFVYSDIAKVDNNSLNSAFKVYPNPTSSYIFIEYSGAVKTPIRIMDMNGRMVKSLFTTGAKTRVATNELAAGTYVVSIDGKTQKLTVKK